MRAFALAALLTLAGCSPVLRPPDPVPDSSCAAAGARLESLGCRLGDAGATASEFAARCARAAADGRTWRADCLATIQDCRMVQAAYAADGACP